MQKEKECLALSALKDYNAIEDLKHKSLEEVFALITETALKGIFPEGCHAGIMELVKKNQLAIDMEKIKSQNTSKDVISTSLEELYKVITNEMTSFIEELKK